MKSKVPAGNTKAAKEAKAKLASDWLGEEGEAVNDLPPVSQAETNELARVFGSDEIIRTPPEQRREYHKCPKERSDGSCHVRGSCCSKRRWKSSIKGRHYSRGNRSSLPNP